MIDLSHPEILDCLKRALENIRVYAEAGANFASSSAITPAAPAVDISFRPDLV
jgi:hypothetical protein